MGSDIGIKRGPGAASKLMLALLTGTIGGSLFYLLDLPLAWMLGAMTACAAAAILKAPVAMPKFARPPMSAIIGSMLGSAFTPDILGRLQHWIVPLLGLIAYLIVSGTLCSLYFRYIVRLDRTTAFFSGMPGGLVDMTLMGGEKGGDEKVIALVHAARIFLVVLCLPVVIELVTGIQLSSQSGTYRPWSALHLDELSWLAGALFGGVALGHVLRLPAKFLIGPMLVSAIVHAGGFSDFVLPSAVVAAAQIVLGSTLGCRFAGTSLRLMLRIVIMSLGSTAILLLLTTLFSIGLARVTDVSVEGLLLSYSPGGLAEMSLVAFALGLEVPLVVAHHMARVFLVVAGVGLFFRTAKPD